MSTKPSKRRRIDTASKQSKLHHFFATPAQKSTYVLDKLTSQSGSQMSSQASQSGIQRNSLASQKSFLESKDRKQSTFLNKNNSNSNSFGTCNPHQRKRLHANWLAVPETSESSPNIINFDSCEIEKASDLECSTEQIRSHMRSDDTSFTLLDSSDFNSLPHSQEITVKSDVSQNKQPVTDLNELENYIGPKKDESQSNSASSFLQSCDINTVPFSIAIGGLRDDDDSSHRISGKAEQMSLGNLCSSDINTVPYSQIVGEPLIKNKSTSLILEKVNPKVTANDRDDIEDSTLSQIGTCDLMTVPYSPVVGQPKSAGDNFNFNSDSADLNSSDFNTIPHSPTVLIKAFSPHQEIKLGKLNKLMPIAPNNKIELCSKESDKKVNIMSSSSAGDNFNFNSDSADLNSSDFNTIPHSPTVLIKAFSPHQEIKLGKLNKLMPIAPNNKIELCSKESDKKVNIMSSSLLEKIGAKDNSDTSKFGDSETQAIVDKIWQMFESSDEESNDSVKTLSTDTILQEKKEDNRTSNSVTNSQLDGIDVDNFPNAEDSLTLRDMDLIRGPDSVFFE